MSSGMPVTYDSTGVVRVLHIAGGNAWLPVANLRAHVSTACISCCIVGWIDGWTCVSGHQAGGKSQACQKQLEVVRPTNARGHGETFHAQFPWVLVIKASEGLATPK